MGVEVMIMIIDENYNHDYNGQYIQSEIYNNPNDITVEMEVNNSYREIINFFKYNMSNVDKELSDSKLIIEGGVCWHWTDWYLRKAFEKNISGIKINFYINKSMGHQLGLIYDTDEYCVVDQTFEPVCRRLTI